MAAIPGVRRGVRTVLALVSMPRPSAAAGVLLAALSLLLGAPSCADGAGGSASSPIPGDPPRERVVIDGRVFKLEVAADQPTRVQGLSDRREIAEDGGMLFVFPDATQRRFVMRHCYVPIDIVFLDAQGRVTAMHQMEVEPPKRDNEDEIEYESRLPQYSSRFDAQFALEFKGGTLDELDLERGDVIDLDLERLKGMAR